MISKNSVSFMAMLIVLLAAVSNSGCGGGLASTSPRRIRGSLRQTAARVLAGSTAQFTATVPNDSASKGVNWTVSCSATACGTVSPTATPSGTATTYTAPAMPPASDLKVTLTATSVADGTKTASVIITVPAGITVSVAPATATVQPGATAQLTATVNNDAANAGVTWNVSCTPAVSGEPGMPCGSVSPTATPIGTSTIYTAPAVGDLVVTVTAASVTNGNALASATIRVRGIAVSVAPGFATVKVGTSAPFTATVTNDAANRGVTWSLFETVNGGLVPGSPAA